VVPEVPTFLAVGLGQRDVQKWPATHIRSIDLQASQEQAEEDMTQDEKIKVLRAALERAAKQARKLSAQSEVPLAGWLDSLSERCEKALDITDAT
jgi:hypothetical protein